MLTITIQKYIAEQIEMDKKGDWYIYPDRRKEIGQYFVDENDARSLVAFYAECIVQTFSSSEKKLFENLKPDIDSVCKRIKSDFVSAFKDIDGMIKALYFEYNGSEGHFYLCNEFDPNNNDWASNYVSESEDIDFEAFMGFYEWNLEAHKESILRDYGNAVMLASLIESKNEIQMGDVKVGFSEHDFEIVVIN